MLQWFETRAWQIGAIGGGVVALGLAVTLGITTVQKIGLERDLAKSQREVVQLSTDLRTCRSNTLTLEKSIEAANAEVDRVAQERDARVAQAQAEVAAARQQTAAAQSRINRLLSAPATGTVCERVDQVDRAILESFQ